MTATTQNLVQCGYIGSGVPVGTNSSVILAQVAKTLGRWSDRASQRRRLSRLTLRELDDVGISVDAAVREAAKPFWRA